MYDIAICFIVKDGESYTYKNLMHLQELKYQKIERLKFFYVENDSTDNTIKILQSLSNIMDIDGLHLKIDSSHSTELCKGEKDNCGKRTRRLSYLRQKVIELALQKTTESTKFIVMIDLDFLSMDLKQFMGSLEYIYSHDDIDGLFSMSHTVQRNGCVYDIGAMIPPEREMTVLTSRFQRILKVRSAFGGFGFYRRSSILKYSASYNTNTNDIEHIDFNRFFPSLVVDSNFKPLYDGVCHVSFFIRRFFVSLVLIIIVLSMVLIIIYRMLTKKSIQPTAAPLSKTPTPFNSRANLLDSKYKGS